MAINPLTGLEEDPTQQVGTTTGTLPPPVAPATTQTGLPVTPQKTSGTLAEGVTPAASVTPSQGQTLPTGTGLVPPPPPPPPPPPVVPAANMDLQSFASSWMANPNPFNADFPTAVRKAGDEQRALQETKAKSSIADWAQSRGLVGSSYEGDQQNNLQAQLQAERDTQESNLLQMIANAQNLGMVSAGNQGLETAKVEQGQQALTAQSSQFAQTLAEQQTTRLQQYGISQQSLGLEAQKIQSDAALQGKSLDITQANNQAEINLRSQQLVQQAKTEGRTLDLQAARDTVTHDLAVSQLAQNAQQFAQTLGVQEQDIALKAKQLQQDAVNAGRTLDLQAARDEASRQLGLSQLNISQQEVDQRAAQLVQDAKVQGRTLDLQAARDEASKTLANEQLAFEQQKTANDLTQRQAEFAATQGLNERQFVAAQDQFTQKISEDRAVRLQQDAQFQATLGNTIAQQAIETGLKTQALALQKQGLDADTAYKQAGLAQEKDLKQQALDLQQQGMNKDDSYRYAALSQDAGFKQQALDLQGKGLSLQDAWKQADLAFQGQQLKQQQSQFEQEFQRKVALDTTDQQRFNDMLDIYQKYFKVDPKSLPNSTTLHGTPDLGNPDVNAGGS